MGFFLAPFVGSGTELDPFRPPVDGPHNLVDLRPDVTQPGLCLLWSPEPPKGRSVVLGDDPDGDLPSQVKQRLGNDLKLNIEATRLADIVAELAITHRIHDDDPRHPNPIDFKRRMRRDPKDGALAQYRGIYLGPPGERIWEQYYKGGPGAMLSETWNAPDTTDGDISADLTWTKTRGTGGSFEIESNQITLKAGGGSTFYRAESDLSTDDMYVEATLTGAGISNNGWYILARHHASAITLYRWRINGDDSIVIHRVVTDSFTSLASGTLSVSLSLGQIQRFEADGSDLEGFYNSVSELTATDSNITGHTRAGVGGFATGDDRVQFDNWEAGDLGGATVNELAGEVAGAGTLSGDLHLLHSLVGELAGVDSLSGSILRVRDLTGDIAGVGSLSGALLRVRDLAGSIDGLGTLSGVLTLVVDAHELTGAIEGTSTLSGEMVRVRDLSGGIEGVGSLSGTLAPVRNLAGEIVGVATLEGSILRVRDLTGEITGQGTLSGKILLVVDHGAPGPLRVDIDPYSTEVALDPSLTAVELDPSITHVSIDTDRTTT